MAMTLSIWSSRSSRRERAAIVVRRRRRQHVDRVADAGRRGQKGSQLGAGVVGQCRQRQTVRLAGIGRQDAGASGVREDRDAPPSWNRLIRQERRHVEHLLEPLGANDAGVTKERVDDGVARRERAGVRARGASPG